MKIKSKLMIFIRILIVTEITSIFAAAQINRLEMLRFAYCLDHCEMYKQQLTLHKKMAGNPPPPPRPKRSGCLPRLLNIFRIPLSDRLQLYPFSDCDSVVLATPKILETEYEMKNYLDFHSYDKKQSLSRNQLDNLSSFLFNYFTFNNFNRVRTIVITSGQAIAAFYPDVILLFYRGGSIHKYLALPYNASERTNFSEEQLISLDLSYEKEALLIDNYLKFLSK